MARCSSSVRAFRKLVLEHYRDRARDLPWRQTADPWHILVSEIMLQQTQVSRVAEKFVSFIGCYPTPAALAASSPADVLGAWQGLGYNRRALSLMRAARMIVEEQGGKVPDDPAVLASLPGIGPATAAAICVYAFNRPLAYIETNIRAVFLHHFFPGRKKVGDAELLPLVEQMLDRADPRRWCSALMDYGTELKRRVGSQNERSAHYARQAPFAGSRRQLRGALLRELLAGRKREGELLALTGRDPGEVRAVLEDLVREGAVEYRRKWYDVHRGFDSHDLHRR